MQGRKVGCELEEKEKFWLDFDKVMHSIPRSERVVIGADFNGHVSADSVTTNESIVHDIIPENCEIGVLDSGKTIRDFIDDTIKERASQDIEDPFYVANLDRLYMTHLRWLANLPRVRPFYAVKCNDTPAILKMLRALGTGFDCASKNEIKLILSLGGTPDDIIYAHTIKPLSHIKYAYAHGINRMTFDNEEELVKVSLNHPNAKMVLRIAVDDSQSTLKLSSKFGASLESVGKLLKRAKELGMDVIGVSFHAGSLCSGKETYKQAIADARHVFDIANFLGFKMSLLDIGGGFSSRNDLKLQFEEISEVINETLDEFFPSESGVTVIAEPGQFYAQPVFTLAANIVGKSFVMDDVDKRAGDTEKMMLYINEGLYGALGLAIVHPGLTNIQPYPYRAVKNSEKRYKTVFWGPTCDSIDKLLGTHCLPEMQIGEWILIDDIGAYSVTMSTEFNGFKRTQLYTVVSADTWSTLHLYDIYNKLGNGF
ncbi:ornithine decarboxylase 1-like [Antennarius striatus]|uniref:ornithine decarboxylase 1-like n=1 Tax=Antennarius striatus TaxID=241820 RepID=UPI0035B1FF25